MKFTPISEADAATAGLWPSKIYDFEVIESADETSNAGNEMIKLNVAIFNDEGKHRKIFDYLVASEKTQYKVRHFAAATGLLPLYEKGELRAEDCMHKTGRCQVRLEPAAKGYPAKNTIGDYVPVVAGAPLIASKAPEEMQDDEIPF